MRILGEALTFDDVLLIPGHSNVVPRDVDLTTNITREIQLSAPVVSAAMDTVTEARLAIAMAQEGGLGIVHKNMSAEAQAAEVQQVKKYESGVISEPITIGPTATIGEVVELTQANHISGVPVVDGNDLVGIVTSRDLRFETRMEAPVTEIMTPRERLVTVPEGADRGHVLELLHKHRIEKVLVVNDDFQLRGMITVKDIQKSTEHPHACKDDRGRLRVGAAVGVGAGTDASISASRDREDSPWAGGGWRCHRLCVAPPAPELHSWNSFCCPSWPWPSRRSATARCSWRPCSACAAAVPGPYSGVWPPASS